jgi:hypothetical protein
MRTFWGLVLGFLLFFPGTVLLQWVTKALGLYQNLTLSEACLVIMMVLLTVFVVQHLPARAAGAEGQRQVGRQAAGPRPRPYGSETRSTGRRPGHRD